jgi:S1-C subfamily serine protease
VSPISFAKEENASIQKIGYNENQFTSVVVIKSPKGSLGTGFYISENIIITNQHVVEGSNFIDLELRDGSESFGKVIKSDPDLDLALVRVEKKGKPIMLANKYDINIGERADAIGHPRGLTFSITRGIVSAVRTMGGIKYIQTDASISPGNSGGPLYQNKKVIGINTWKRADNLSEGLGFAIHIDEIQKFISDL